MWDYCSVTVWKMGWRRPGNDKSHKCRCALDDAPDKLDLAYCRSGGKDESVCGAMDKASAVEARERILDGNTVAEFSGEITPSAVESVVAVSLATSTRLTISSASENSPSTKNRAGGRSFI
jgi:hypothetical protein